MNAIAIKCVFKSPEKKQIQFQRIKSPRKKKHHNYIKTIQKNIEAKKEKENKEKRKRHLII